jgi:isopentenyl-diphosphate Delta-isomerase
MNEERVVLVDTADNEVGTAPKLQAHRTGDLHRAISVFVFDSGGRMLLQRRADGKYHSGGLWSNTCCSHPRPGEPVATAARRRLHEEMGLDCELEPAFTFVYRADLDGGLTEHELDHVFVGTTDDSPEPDPDEVGGWRWIEPGEITREMESDPERFTAWFPIAFRELLERRGKAIT